MNSTSHSECHKLESVIVKPVQHAFVSEELVQEQRKPLHFLSKPDFKLSLKEYADFEAIFKNRDIEVMHLTL